MPRSPIQVLLLSLLLLAGCTGLRGPEDAPPTPLDPSVDEEELAEHLSFLNGPQVRQGAAGGMTQASSYAAARLKDYGVQPVLADGYRLLHGAPANVPLGARLTRTAPDSLDLVPGIDIAPHPATAPLALRTFEEVVRDGGGAVVVRIGPTPVDTLRTLARRGVQLVLDVGVLRPGRAPAPVPRLGVLGVSPAAAAALLGMTRDALWAWLEGAGEPRRRLPSPAMVEIQAAWDASRPAIATLGYHAGVHPEHHADLVIVCADLDVTTSYAGVPVVDPARIGMDAAALLELARIVGHYGTYWPLPERAILFALWPGAAAERQGLGTFLRLPPWPLDRVHSVVYIGLDAAGASTVRTMLAPYDIPLYVVDGADGRPEARFRPGSALRRRWAQGVGRGERVPGLPPEPARRAVVAEAAALTLRALPVVMREATTDDPLLPAPHPPPLGLEPQGDPGR